DTLLNIIGAAQEPDGYLYTFRTAKPLHPHEWMGKKRWEKDEDLSHELYNCGHLYEAAVAHYLATRKRTLLNIALKNADLLIKDFGWGKTEVYPGHPVVEMGLVKLYRVTGEKKYLDLAKFFLDVRGPQSGNPGSEYNQSDKKIKEQHNAEGHAVRAAYLYTGVADVAALTDDQDYLNTIDDIWNDVVEHKLYITGGIGATGNGEAFGSAYDLPNMSAYAETCAAIANVYWNQRMFLLHGDAKYIDVLERTLYNGLLSGVSLSGNRFFYPNPLASIGQHWRSAWFACACCITNIARFMPSMPGYIYGQNGNRLYINLFVADKATFQLPAGKVTLEQQTNYPWNGAVSIKINPEHAGKFALHIRIPGWARGSVLPSDLYRFADAKEEKIIIKINGQEVNYTLDKGYAVFDRKWKAGDKIEMELPMDIEKVLANKKVTLNDGSFALQRGPLVYCMEGADRKDSSVMSLMADTSSVFNAVYMPDKLNGIEQLTGNGYALKRNSSEGAVQQTNTQLTAIPYYSWNNRGANEMAVWIPYEISKAKPKPAPTIASKSRVSGGGVNRQLMLKALNDQYDPLSSADNSTNYLHWWPKKDTSEWVQYDFDRAYTISSSQVYWYDDGPGGGCRVPDSWKLEYKQNDQWIPVSSPSEYGTKKDQYNRVTFDAVKTTALRMIVQLPKDNSSGIQEWKVE
ncbi:MAG: glycoside hydrolase family 127 protein, partial [Chitinophagaceae bacterium]|nr:glycoside hydrolase family 127 protein [Chitinophagaceae bacterium]